jgi:hypothetical protein
MHEVKNLLEVKPEDSRATVMHFYNEVISGPKIMWSIWKKKIIKVSLKLTIDVTLLQVLWPLIIDIYTRNKVLHYVWISLCT